MEPLDPESLIRWLQSLPFPRPFVWYPFVYWKRAVYGIFGIIVLAACVGGPIYDGFLHTRSLEPFGRLLSYQIGIFFGAMVVLVFVRVAMVASRMFDDCKWLARFGAVADASLLWVMGSDKSAQITYRFWDLHGRERTREAFVTAENGVPLPSLAAGDIIPVLFDPHKPDSRNLLWIEVSRYVRIAPQAASKGALTEPSAANPAPDFTG